MPSRNVSVRVVTSVPSVRTNSTDLKVLKQKGLDVTPPPPLLVLYIHCSVFLSFGCTPSSGLLLSEGVQVRKVNFGRLTRGVLHSKFWIVDRKHLFIGSANMDWRALTQVTSAIKAA